MSKTRTTEDDGRIDNKHPPKSLAGLTALQRDALWTTHHHGPTKGLDILYALRTYRGETILNGHFYERMGDLVDAGLVEKSQDPDDGRAKQFELTDAGERALAARQVWQKEGDE